MNDAGRVLAEGLSPDGFSYYRLDPIVPEPALNLPMVLGFMYLRLVPDFAALDGLTQPQKPACSPEAHNAA
jgi:hypothetical protein